MTDLEAALAKMDLAAKKAVYLFLSAESWMPMEIQRLVYGEPLPISLSDHIVVYNLLDSIGILANVEILNYESKRNFETFDGAVSEIAKIYNVPASRIEALKEYLRNTLVENTGKFWYIRNKKVAMIWWTKME